MTHPAPGCEAGSIVLLVLGISTSSSRHAPGPERIYSSMSLELVNALAALGTFVVITATAIAAVIQLRHLRTSNQLTAFMTITHDFESPEFRELQTYIRNDLQAKMCDPGYRDEVLDRRGVDRVKHPEAVACAFFEGLGLVLKRRLVDEAIFLDAFALVIIRNWEALSPFVAIRRERGGPADWENFEYVAVRAYQWVKRYPNGTLPKNFPRLPVVRPTPKQH